MKMSDYKEVTNLREQLNTIRLLSDKISDRALRALQDPVRLWVSPPTGGADVFMFASHKNMMELLGAEASNLVEKLRNLGVEVDQTTINEIEPNQNAASSAQPRVARTMLECDLRSYCRCFTADERRSCEHLVDARECWWTPEAKAEKR